MKIKKIFLIYYIIFSSNAYSFFEKITDNQVLDAICTCTNGNTSSLALQGEYKIYNDLKTKVIAILLKKDPKIPKDCEKCQTKDGISLYQNSKMKEVGKIISQGFIPNEASSINDIERDGCQLNVINSVTYPEKLTKIAQLLDSPTNTTQTYLLGEHLDLQTQEKKFNKNKFYKDLKESGIPISSQNFIKLYIHQDAVTSIPQMVAQIFSYHTDTFIDFNASAPIATRSLKLDYIKNQDALKVYSILTFTKATDVSKKKAREINLPGVV